MNYTGEIKLIRVGKVIHSFTYYDRESRKLKIDAWKRLYRDIDDVFELAIIPFVIDEPEKRPQGRPKKQPQRPFVRPPAVYDNVRSLYQI